MPDQRHEPSCDVTVVIPVYNGRQTVGKIVEETLEELRSVDSEVVLVDDGSSDGSWEEIERLAATSGVRGVKLLKNYGQHAAVFAGLGVAAGRWVVTIDDDGENNPADILGLIEVAEQGGHDLVFAERTGRGGSLTRRLGSNLVNAIVIRVFNAPDGLRISNYRVMSHDVVRRLVSDETQYPYINGLALEYSGNPTSSPVRHREHAGPGSRYTVRTIARLLTNILFSYSIWAYRLVVGIALIAIAIAGGVSVVALARAGLSNDSAPGWASLVLLFSVMSAANLIALTVVGEYVVRSLRQSRGPARFVIDRLISTEAASD